MAVHAVIFGVLRKVCTRLQTNKVCFNIFFLWRVLKGKLRRKLLVRSVLKVRAVTLVRHCNYRCGQKLWRQSVFSVMCYARSSTTLSWLGILWGVLSLVTLLTAFVSNVWLFTREPIRLPNSEASTSITFKIGLWRVCPTVRRPNNSQSEYFILRTFFLYKI